MILGFKQYFPWRLPNRKEFEPTDFREKILNGTSRQELWTLGLTKDFGRKLHTIRLDPHNLWKPNMSIQMVYRGPKYSILDHFNKDIPELEKCKSVQSIEIKWVHYTSGSFSGTKRGFRIAVWIDGVSCDDKLALIARNDGFNSSNDFCRWFSKDFTGKILHWTDLRY